jgi:hypothetical protein
MRHAIHHPPARRGRPRRRSPAVRVAAPVVLVVGGLMAVAAIASFVLMLALMVGVPMVLGAAAFVAVRHARRAARHGRLQGLHGGPHGPVPVAPPRREPDWSRARRRFEALRAEYAAHECDPMTVLRLPALSDVAVPSTGRFVEAFAEAQALETEERPPDAHAASFVAAVDRAERAWRAAVDAAERIRLSGLSPAERGTVERVIKLLTTARDSDYSRARSELARLDRAGVVHLPRPAAAALDAAARGELPA